MTWLASAQTRVSNKQTSPTQEKDPPKRGTPPSKEGTGSRGDCIYKQDKPPLTRIVGGTKSQFTIRDYPTVWVYVPYTAPEVNSGEFTLQDGDIEVFRTRLKLPSKSGIIGITFPSKIPALKVGQEYRWYLDINCSDDDSSSNSSTPASVTGIVHRKRITRELESDLKAAKTPLDKVFVYAKHQIWYEAITELAQLRLNDPNNSVFQKVWMEMNPETDMTLNIIYNP